MLTVMCLNKVRFWKQLTIRSKLQQDRQKEAHDRRRHGKLFKESDIVMLYTPVVPRAHCKKLMCPWCIPYEILKKLSEVTYRIQHCKGKDGSSQWCNETNFDARAQVRR